MKLGRYLTQQTEGYILSVQKSAWQRELEKAALKYHIMGAWMAIIFDPLFVITDVINIPDHWRLMLVIRICVSLITLIALRFWRQFKLQSHTLIAIPFIAIAIQESFGYTLIDNQQVLAHSVNFVALLIGGGMFIIWKWQYSIIICLITFASTFLFAFTNPKIEIASFIVRGGFLLFTVACFMIFLIQTRYNLTLKEIKARLALVDTNKELEEQKNIIQDKNQRITSSITAAKRIQDAILGSRDRLNHCFENSFVFFQPKDILSGDFYWFHHDERNDIKIVIAADCTGHGIPAALTTVLGNSILNEIIIKHNITQPDVILRLLDKKIIENFTEGFSDSATVNDGMDVGILVFKNDEVYFSGANSPLFYTRNNEIHQIKGSRFPIGSNHYSSSKQFQLHQLKQVKGDRYFLFSDGFQDQLGGPYDKKYLTKCFREFVDDSNSLPLDEQGDAIVEEFIQWKGNQEQTDDVLIVGLEL